MRGRTGLQRVALVIAAVPLTLVTSCTADTDSTDATSDDPATTEPTSATDADVPPPPKTGQCHNTPAKYVSANSWVDPKPPVDCSQRHTLETVEVIDSAEALTLPLVKQLAATCEAATGEYVGNPGLGVYRLVYPVVYWPSREQRAAGHSWVRCDIGLQATTHCCSPLAPQTGSLHNVAVDHLARLQQCIAQVPEPSRRQPLTSCERPHRAELLTSRLTLTVDAYPDEATLQKEGKAGCARFVSALDKPSESLEIMPFWQSESDWSGGELVGGCWIYSTDALLPAL